MRIIHTSDWHLGKSLYNKTRYDEFEAFLNWLVNTLEEQEAHTLLISGDIFDTSNPSHRSQELYYRFLCRAAGGSCRHVVITAGNHDSPDFIKAPKDILKYLDVHVAGSISENPEDEVLVLKNSQGEVELIVCAVPYLRDRDIRSGQYGESLEDKDKNLIQGIASHYEEVCRIACEKRSASGKDVPIIAMGHLFTLGGRVTGDEKSRKIYAGGMGHVQTEIFPKDIDYFALGHLHIPQEVKGCSHIRYSGSPIAMSFKETGHQKSLCVVDFESHPLHPPKVELIDIPVFQELVPIKGGLEDITSKLNELICENSSAWLEIVYSGEEIPGNLRDRLEPIIGETGMEILCVKNDRIMEMILKREQESETLDSLTEENVFMRCLDTYNVPQEQREELIWAYQETLRYIDEKGLLEKGK